MTTPMMGYYRCTAKSARNAEFPIHVLVAHNLDWPETVIQKRALTLRARRPMDARELAIRKRCFRAGSMKYKTLAGLIEDERATGQGEDFITQLQIAFKGLA